MLLPLQAGIALAVSPSITSSAELLFARAVGCRYPEGDAQQLHQALLLLKKIRHLHISAFWREALAEKLERLEAVK